MWDMESFIKYGRMYNRCDTRLKDYKGYEIYKSCFVNEEGNKVKGLPFFYFVADNDDCYELPQFSLDEAKKFIDNLICEVK